MFYNFKIENHTAAKNTEDFSQQLKSQINMHKYRHLGHQHYAFVCTQLTNENSIFSNLINMIICIKVEEQLLINF